MSDVTKPEKLLSIPLLVIFIVVYLTIIQGMSLLLTAGQRVEFATFPTVESLIRGLTIPVGLSVIFLAIVITYLGWWKRVSWERMRLGRRAWSVPVLMVLSIVLVTNYTQLEHVSSTMILTLLVSVLLVGIGEELMFRGIVLEAIRASGRTTELKVALLTAIIFGGAHVTNIFIEGSGAFLQAAMVTTMGMFLYIALRVSGTILVPIILHAAWDFSMFSGNIGADPEPSAFVIIALLTNLVLTIIVAVRWRAIWPTAAAD